ncbi:MAG: lamin tail domain-containing protein [Balneolaceae bacterium]
MSRTLLTKAHFRTLHIALIFSFALFSATVKSQSILIPGDAVFVSVNSEANSFEISPLVALKKGTKLYFSTGVWNSSTGSIESETELEVHIDSLFSAGSIIYIGDDISSGITINGELKLSLAENNLYLYQKEDNLLRFISNINWGTKVASISNSIGELDLPEVLTTPQKNYVQLGPLPNYQYYIRNGVSGTPEMIRSLVTNAENWVGSDKNNNTRIGTYFSILKPPVVLFDQSISTVSDDKDSVSINISIYEHDGSKLTVEVGLDTLNSSLSNKYLGGFNKTEINFSGLIGDGVYEIKVPLNIDETREGLETGIFELRNLSKGSFGDFVTHTMLVNEAKKPAIKMQLVSYQNEQGILFYNIDNNSVDISNWNIARGKRSYTFPSNTQIRAGEKLLIGLKSMEIPTSADFDRIILDDKNASLLKETGTVVLYTSKQVKVDEVKVQAPIAKDVKSPNSLQQQKAFTPAISSIVSSGDVAGKAIPLTPSWQELAVDEDFIRDNPELTFYQWNEAKAGYFEVEASTFFEVSNTMMAFFEESDFKKLSDIRSKKKLDVSPVLNISLSATDANKNGQIDELEGLNRILNTTELPILVGDLHQQLVSLEGIGSEPYTFVETDKGIISLSNNKYIAPGQVFWLKLRDELTSTVVDLNFSEPILEEEKHLSSKEELGSFGLT